MHRDDLMNPDLLSEIVLLGSATLIFITLVAILVTSVGWLRCKFSASQSDHY
jgi:hypothetical protein